MNTKAWVQDTNLICLSSYKPGVCFMLELFLLFFNNDVSLGSCNETNELRETSGLGKHIYSEKDFLFLSVRLEKLWREALLCSYLYISTKARKLRRLLF